MKIDDDNEIEEISESTYLDKPTQVKKRSFLKSKLIEIKGKTKD